MRAKSLHKLLKDAKVSINLQGISFTGARKTVLLTSGTASPQDKNNIQKPRLGCVYLSVIGLQCLQTGHTLAEAFRIFIGPRIP